MAKDKKARNEGRVTVMALANLIAAIVDTMREAEVGSDVIHGFLHRLDHLNAVTLSGIADAIMVDLIDVVRSTVPAND